MGTGEETLGLTHRLSLGAQSGAVYCLLISQFPPVNLPPKVNVEGLTVVPGTLPLLLFCCCGYLLVGLAFLPGLEKEAAGCTIKGREIPPPAPAPAPAPGLGTGAERLPRESAP